MSPDFLQTHWVALLLAVIGVAVAAYVVMRHGTKIRTFVNEVKVELKKASWPWDAKERGVKKYKELIDSTLMVVVAMLLLGGYIAFWDFILVSIVGSLTR